MDIKLFHFNPNDHNSEYYIMAENKNDAHQFLLNYLYTQSQSGSVYSDMYYTDYKIWKNADVRDNDLPGRYTIDIYYVGQVVESEIA